MLYMPHWSRWRCWRVFGKMVFRDLWHLQRTTAYDITRQRKHGTFTWDTLLARGSEQNQSQIYVNQSWTRVLGISKYNRVSLWVLACQLRGSHVQIRPGQVFMYQPRLLNGREHRSKSDTAPRSRDVPCENFQHSGRTAGGLDQLAQAIPLFKGY